MIPRHGPQVPFRAVGIDPGTTNLGFAVLDLDLQTQSVTVHHVETLDAAKLARDYRIEAQQHGDRYARLTAMEDRLFILLEQFQPHSVCAESPFLRKFPQAFAALTECCSHVRRAVHRFDRHMSMESVDPPTAKMAVGMMIKRGATKDDVKNALLSLAFVGKLILPPEVDLRTLDEHSIDAIAIAYFALKQLREDISNF